MVISSTKFKITGDVLGIHSEKKATITDVAAKSGVSKTTVSRFLNGKYENISRQTMERIQSVIDELDYRPNRTAQRLKASRSMLVGCVIGDVSSPFAAMLLKGIMGACEAAGYQVLFADCNDDPERERMAIESLAANKVDGLILNTAGGNEELFLTLKAEGLPVVLADRGLINEGLIDAVTVPNYDIAYECVRMLKDCGYTRIAFFTEGNRQITPRIRRCAGYCEAVKKLFPAGTEPEIYEFDKDDAESCQSKILEFREKYPGERIAGLSVNGVTTQRLMLALRALDMKFDSNFGLCGFDDWNWLQLDPSGVTSVSLPTRQLGEEAAKLLIERMSGERPADSPAVHIELPARIIMRGSTVKSGE